MRHRCAKKWMVLSAVVVLVWGLTACNGKPVKSPFGSEYQIGVRYKDLSFLNEEQQEVYWEAYELYPLMEYSTDGWELARDGSGFITREIDGRTYYRLAGEYERWEDFKALWLDTFTEGWFEEENLYYKEIDGYAYVLTGAKSGPYPAKETYYEVGFVREDLILFYTNAHYVDEFSDDLDTVYRQEYHTIMLVEDSDGSWRCADFSM